MFVRALVPALALVLGAAASCSGNPGPAPPPPVASASAAPSASPSASAPDPIAPEPDVPLPAVASFDVGDVSLTLLRRAGPIVEARLVVLAGHAHEGTKTGVASVLAESLLESGRAGTAGHDAVVKLEALGAKVGAQTNRDATVFTLTVPQGKFAEAVGLLGALVGKASFGNAELERARTRLAETAARSVTKPEYALPRLLHRELYHLPTERHPYSVWAPNKAEIEAIVERDAKRFHKETYTPKAVHLVVGGDVPEADAKAAAKKLEGAFGKGAAKDSTPEEPTAPESLRIYLVHAPGDASCELRLGFLGRERSAADWPTAIVAGELLASAIGALPSVGKDAQVNATLDDVRHGPGVLGVRVRVTSSQAGAALGAVIDRLDGLAGKLVGPDDVEAAMRAARQRIIRAYESLPAAVDRLAALAALDVDGGADETLRKALRSELPNVAVGKVASELFRSGHAIVVAVGDVDKVGVLLAEHGEVRVLDAAKGYERVRSIQKVEKKKDKS